LYHPPKQSAPAQVARPYFRPRILLVDDDPNNLYLLAKILAPFGQVEQTTNGHTAFAMFKAALASNHRFHLLFLDIMMPELNGRDLFRMIKDHESFWLDSNEAPTTIVMASGIKDQGVIKEFLREGSEFYMTKPFRVEQIKKIMAALGLEAQLPNLEV